MLSTLSWEFNVVDSKQVNAFCMPGGKIVVYTGLLNLVGNGAHSDDELAAVMGHELSHALAKHATNVSATRCSCKLADSSSEPL